MNHRRPADRPYQMTECKRNVPVGRQLEKSAFISALIMAPFGCPIGHNAKPDMLDDNAMRLTFFLADARTS